ncbi:MAG: C1 family peptidase [Bacteroidota bacterium]
MIPCALDAQPPSPYAEPKNNTQLLGIDDIQQIDQLMVYIPGIGSPSREALTRQNIKSYMMPVRQAPNPNHEWAYALAASVEYYVNLNNNFKDNLSPDYIYLSLAAAGNKPNLVDGLKFLTNQGTVSAAIVAYGSATIPRSVFNVPRYYINNFAYLFRPTTRGRNRIFELRKALSRGNPVILELKTGSDFNQWRQSVYETNLPLTETHYVTVVGYDEDAETFELRAANGRLWADAGYVKLTYDKLAEYASHAFLIIPKQ